jgi:peptidoglycan/LPS O-acetylase OafA/YrhL
VVAVVPVRTATEESRDRAAGGRLPRPAEAGHRYIAGLDGLRAIAVLAVIVYHLNVGWAQGGLLGVGVFFTLSGYLSTDLLLEHWGKTGGLGLANFWIRRARRLLPALVVMLAVVITWVALLHRTQLGDLRGNVVAATLYMSNWWLIVQHVSYFARFGPPSPLGHLWSLSVEEQFYLIWPWLLLLGLRFIPERGRARTRPRLATATLILAAASAAEMALLYHPGFDPSRIYDGTDTRAFGLLIGAALAMMWPSRRRRADTTVGTRRALDGVGVVGLVVVGLLIWRTSQYSAFLYRGGLLILSLATAAIVLAVVYPGSVLGRYLGMRPLRWLGVRSYGIYLWHYPIIVLTTRSVQRGFDLPRASLQVGATLVVAALSWRFVEEPIRMGGRLQSAGGLPWYRRVAARWTWVTSTAALALLAGTSLLLGGVLPADAITPFASGNDGGTSVHEVVSNSPPTPGPTATASRATAPRVTAPSATTPPATFPPASEGKAERMTGGAVVTTTTTPGPPQGSATMSSCRSVVHIGDSTSESLVSSNYLPDPAQRLDAQYARVGATNQYLEIVGGTSIVETIDGGPDAYDVAKQLIDQGYHGCWVLALGTNDTADVYVGSHVGVAARIQKMMSIIGNQPVMWVNVRSLLGSGPYSEGNMQKWDNALVQACPSYPNMRIYNWAGVVQPSWFISDGIHYSSLGSAQRAHLIASALAEAFPQAGQRGYSGCLIP